MSKDNTLGFQPEPEKDIELEQRPSVSRPTLVILNPPSQGTDFLIVGNHVTIGRDTQSDIFFNDVTVSRSHAEIVKEASTFRLIDKGSLNGSYVNGKRVENGEIRDGDRLQIGKYQLLFLTGEK